MKRGKKVGKRHRLLLYRRTMDRLWQGTLVLGLLLGLIWWWPGNLLPGLEPQNTLVLGGAGVSLFFAVFGFVTRNMGYVQAREDHLLIATPFIRLKTSYRRFLEVRGTGFHTIFSFNDLPWSQKRYLEPMFGLTAVVVNLKSYPLSPRTLRFFFQKSLFNPRTKGYVLLVDDWMALSTELDSRYGTWRQSRTKPPSYSGFKRGLFDE